MPATSLDAISRAHLKGVHPDLARVVVRAAEISPIIFRVIEGVRSDQRAYELYGKGRTAAQMLAVGAPMKYAAPKLAKVTWLKNPLNSKHRIQTDGYGHAVDLLPAPYDWKVLADFDAVAKAMMQAADELGVKIRWGGDWDRDNKAHEPGESDSPHFELVAA